MLFVLSADFSVTYGKLNIILLLKPLFKSLHFFSNTPVLTLIPCFFKKPIPLPLTFGLGSFVPIITSLMPDFTISLTQGPVLPVKEQGSNVT